MNRREVRDSRNPGRRILIVDDNDDGRVPLAKWLESLGHEVREARDGIEALALAPSFKPEVILLDIAMPPLDGFEVCSRLRAVERGKHVLIYALSGFGSHEHRCHAERAGFDGYFLKPIDLQLMSKVLE